ncbi:hypothetical protein KSP35_00925 [Aquihabitans sp. G128]|uniref:hypothetical protein n=1 Tax=Aquihabitans sp. G128 TaxID=2849779 RepID=UPI001C23B824|nr:hypothetical protein [Aquihabitans sp. G128]QXC61446.1 hypothetical protein KSP35_00925 [Aquihabitans sp. G128]
MIIAIPALTAFIAAGLSLTKHRRRIWFLAAAIIGVVSGGLSILYLFVAGTFGWAYFRANKVEGPPEPLFKRKPREAAAADDVADDADASPSAAS